MNRKNTEPASLLRLEAVESFVEEILEQNHIPKTDIRMILLACDEIFSNICRYGKAREVTVECTVKEDEASVAFEDDGMEFNPLTHPEPDVRRPLETRRIGGLGIYMVQKLMDQVTYERESGKNRLCVIKNIMADGKNQDAVKLTEQKRKVRT